MGIGVTNSNPGGTGIRKVSLREMQVAGFVASLDDIQILLNDLTATVFRGEVLILLVAHYDNGVDGLASFARFAFKNNQETSSFTPDNPIQKENLIPFGQSFSLVNLLAIATQIVELGELGEDNAAPVLNSQIPAIEILSGLIIVQATIAGEPVYYLFIGAAGDYGDGEDQSTSNDFIQLNQYITNGDWTRIGNAIRNNNAGPVEIQGTGGYPEKALIIRDQTGNIVGHWNNGGHIYANGDISARQYVLFGGTEWGITDGGGTKKIVSLSGGKFGLLGLINEIYDMSSAYELTSLVNKKFVQNLVPFYEFHFAVTQVGENNPEIDIISNNSGVNAEFTGLYTENGLYRLDSDVPIFLNNCWPKVFVWQLLEDESRYAFRVVNASRIELKSAADDNLPTNGVFNGTQLMTIKIPIIV